MLFFEIKKVFSKFKNKIAMVLLLIILIVTSILTMNRVEYVDTDGGRSSSVQNRTNVHVTLQKMCLQMSFWKISKLTVPQKHFLKISWSRIRSMPGNRESQISAT